MFVALWFEYVARDRHHKDNAFAIWNRITDLRPNIVEFTYSISLESLQLIARWLFLM